MHINVGHDLRVDVDTILAIVATLPPTKSKRKRTPLWHYNEVPTVDNTQGDPVQSYVITHEAIILSPLPTTTIMERYERGKQWYKNIEKYSIIKSNVLFEGETEGHDE